MKYFFFILRMGFYLFIGVLSLTLVVLLVLASWQKAAPEDGQKPRRLRWHMIAKQKILRGTRIGDDDVTWTVSRIPEDTPYVSAARFAVNRYSESDVEEGALLRPGELSVYAPAAATVNGAVVPVEAKTEYTLSLKPGMQLAFVQGKVILPAVSDAAAGKAEPGFALLSITHSPRDAALTTLSVQVDEKQLKLAPLLATGEWRPVVLGAYKVAETVAKTPAAKRPKPRRPQPRKRRKT
jgi:hypothetical protein